MSQRLADDWFACYPPESARVRECRDTAVHGDAPDCAFRRLPDGQIAHTFSARTEREALASMADFLRAWGYAVTPPATGYDANGSPTE